MEMSAASLLEKGTQLGAYLYNLSSSALKQTPFASLGQGDGNSCGAVALSKVSLYFKDAVSSIFVVIDSSVYSSDTVNSVAKSCGFEAINYIPPGDFSLVDDCICQYSIETGANQRGYFSEVDLYQQNASVTAIQCVNNGLANSCSSDYFWIVTAVSISAVFCCCMYQAVKWRNEHSRDAPQSQPLLV